MMEDWKLNVTEDFGKGSERYTMLKSELTDLNMQKVRLEQMLNEAVAESTATILEQGTSNFVDLQT